MAQAVGAQVLLSDDADAYKIVADGLGLEHQVCQHHTVPNTLALLAAIAGQLEKRREGALREENRRWPTLEEIILGRCPGSQGRLDVLARRYERVGAG